MQVDPPAARRRGARPNATPGQVGSDPVADHMSPVASVETIAIDPVCGMPVARERSLTLERDGRLVSFCSRGCRDEFLGVAPMREEARAEELVRRVLDEPVLLRPAFQPILSLETRTIVGYEGLTRFAPVPLQPPEAWFGLAARAGLTAELEALALRAAFDIAAQRPPPTETFLSLNLSPLLIDDPRIRSVLLAPSVAPERLVLELTEHDQVDDYAALRTVVAPYRAQGFRIAVDDAGAGYASLRHITELRPDFVKLDARLIRDLTGDLARQALVRAMATFVDEIGAVLVAEGVEQLDDLDLLVRAGRPILVQGYAVGRASDPWPTASAEALRQLGSQRRPRRAAPPERPSPNG